MKFSRALSWFVLLGLCLPVQAVEIWTDSTTIVQVYPHDTGVTLIVTYSNPVSTCGGTRYLIAKTAPNYEALISALYMAYAADFKVQLHLFDQAPSCDPTVDRFIVSKQ